MLIDRVWRGDGKPCLDHVLAWVIGDSWDSMETLLDRDLLLLSFTWTLWVAWCFQPASINFLIGFCQYFDGSELYYEVMSGDL